MVKSIEATIQGLGLRDITPITENHGKSNINWDDIRAYRNS